MKKKQHRTIHYWCVYLFCPGTLQVNDEPLYYGESAGDFQGLDLAEPLYVGNVPDVTTIPPSARFRSGFIGKLPIFFRFFCD